MSDASGVFTQQASRTKSGKKIATWSHHFPDDGVAHIDVSMIASSTEAHFEARSPHPLLKGKSWADSDIKRLADTIKNDIETIYSQNSADRWEPAMVVEISNDSSTGLDMVKAGLSVSYCPVKLDTKTVKSNDGKTRILRHGTPGFVNERTMGDNTGTSFGDQTIKLEADSSRFAVKLTEESLTRIQGIQKTLDAFTALVGARISPNKAQDLPEKKELVEMMRKAVGDAD